MGVKEADRGIAKYVIVYMNCILKSLFKLCYHNCYRRGR